MRSAKYTTCILGRAAPVACNNTIVKWVLKVWQRTYNRRSASECSLCQRTRLKRPHLTVKQLKVSKVHKYIGEGSYQAYQVTRVWQQCHCH